MTTLREQVLRLTHWCDISIRIVEDSHFILLEVIKRAEGKPEEILFSKKFMEQSSFESMMENILTVDDLGGLKS